MIEIIFANYDTTHKSDFVFDSDDTARDWWLLLQTHTPAYFTVGETHYVMPAKSAILYPPYAPLHYGAHNSHFKNDWIRFYTDEEFICRGNVPFEKPFEVKEFAFTHLLFQQLSTENFYDNKNRTASILALFQLMFYKLEESLSYQSDDAPSMDLLALRQSIKNDPAFNWTIPYMASLLHVSTGHLHTLYRDTFGITCMEDVIEARIRLAMDYLKNSATPIHTIALICGYKNVEHFNRQFKKYAHMSPSAYRQKE